MKTNVRTSQSFTHFISSVTAGVLLTLAAVSCSSDNDSVAPAVDYPYKDIPAKLLTDQGKLNMVRSIQNVKDGRFFYLDYTQDYKLQTIASMNLTDNTQLIGAVLGTLCDSVPSLGRSAVKLDAGCSAFAATTPDGSNAVIFTYDGATADKSGVFYLPMALGTYDLTVKVYDKVNTLICTTIKEGVQIERGHIKKLAVNSAYALTYNDHGFIDLGLPSHTLWAETNVGATIATEYGNHYTWAETATKSHYGYDNDSHFNFSKGTWSKYTTESGLITLEAADDAASVNWGKLCHMPSLAEITELLDAVNCTWTKTTETVSGKASNGFKVTSKTNGNSIFLPAAGYNPGYTTSYTGGSGFYWSSSLVTGCEYDDDAYMITFCNSGKMHYEGRSFGLSVRAVVNP